MLTDAVEDVLGAVVASEPRPMSLEGTTKAEDPASLVTAGEERREGADEPPVT
jgi:hypothetical protein